MGTIYHSFQMLCLTLLPSSSAPSLPPGIFPPVSLPPVSLPPVFDWAKKLSVVKEYNVFCGLRYCFFFINVCFNVFYGSLGEDPNEHFYFTKLNVNTFPSSVFRTIM